ncbi:MAG: LysR family transcriptional regulator [Myxococcota bacterium]
MEIRELRAFMAVATELNFNRAAERLNMSQPPLTRLIQRLEHSLGVLLFERTTRRVRLTAAGERLVQEAVPFLAQADLVARTVRHEVADRTRFFRLGCTALAFQTVLPEVLTHFQADHEGVEVDVQELPSDRLMSDLQTAELDFALVLLPQSHRALSVEPLLKQRMRLAVSRSHPLAASGRAPLSAFSSDRFIMHMRGDAPAMYDEIVRCCAVAGFRPRMLERNSDNTCTGLVAANVGVHFVAATPDCLASAEIVFVEIDEPAPILELGAAWRMSDPSRLVADFLERCRNASSQDKD